MYIPDWHMVKKLKDYDKKLNVRWVEHRQRWAITREVIDTTVLTTKEAVLFLCENPDKSYRPLDDRVLYTIKKSDSHTRKTEEMIEEMIDANKKETESNNRERKNEFEAIASEMLPAGGFEDDSMGSRNVPKEDIESPEEYTEKRLEKAYIEDQEALAV